MNPTDISQTVSKFVEANFTDTTNTHAAILISAATDPSQRDDDDITEARVSSLYLGDPTGLAQVLVAAIDNMGLRIPGFQTAFISALSMKKTQALKNAIERGVEDIQLSRLSSETQDLLDKIRNFPTPPSTTTNQ
jgi:hypothetical protein